MIVVSDTVPLRYLIFIDEVNILESLFTKILIPQAVFEDMQRPKTPQKVKDWMNSQPGWLEIRQADISLYTPQKRIGAGQREAFALALELNADAVLLDDNGARVEANRLKLTTIRTLDILERAARQELIDLPQAIAKLAQTNFRLPPQAMIDAMLDRYRLQKEIKSRRFEQLLAKVPDVEPAENDRF